MYFLETTKKLSTYIKITILGITSRNQPKPQTKLLALDQFRASLY